MITYSRAVLLRYDAGFNTIQYHGKLADGIYFLPLGAKSKRELDDTLDIPEAGNKIGIWIDHKLLAHRNNREKNDEYYHLILQLNIFCKIYIAPHCGIIRPSQYKYTAVESDIHQNNANTLSNNWTKFCDAYSKNKLIFRLYGISTVENTDYIFNIMNSAVALEGLLLQGEKSENAYKFRIRGAFLLGKTYRTREKYYKILKLAYEMRSAVTHANDKEKTRVRNKIKSDLKMTMKTFNDELIKINRILLQQLINNSHFYDDLDQIVLNG